MKVIRADTAGFCMGVSLALKKLDRAVRERAAPICTLGPIIHNPQVLVAYEARGVRCLDTAQSASREDCVLIRAHGIPREMEAMLRERCALVEDATCPKVKKAQLAISGATHNGGTLLLFGEESHPEVAGLISYACGSAYVFDSLAALERIPLRPELGYVLASQTTQDRDAFDKIAEWLKGMLRRLIVLSTICDATKKRQEEALRIAEQVDVMVVVGGRASGNTRRLANLSQSAGKRTFLVETAAELVEADFADSRIAGLTAGASTPCELIDAVENSLRAL